MGTGAVYVTLSQLRNTPDWLRGIEVAFYFLNVSLFIFNCMTLLLQLICKMNMIIRDVICLPSNAVYPQQSKRILFDPVKGVFVPLMVRMTFVRCYPDANL